MHFFPFLDDLSATALVVVDKGKCCFFNRAGDDRDFLPKFVVEVHLERVVCHNVFHFFPFLRRFYLIRQLYNKTDHVCTSCANFFSAFH